MSRRLLAFLPALALLVTWVACLSSAPAQAGGLLAFQVPTPVDGGSDAADSATDGPDSAPPFNTPINIASVGDSFAADYEGTNPPVEGLTYTPPLASTFTGYPYQGAYLLQQAGYTNVSFTSYGISGTSLWQWLAQSGSFSIPTPVAGAKNVLIDSIGTNDSIMYSTEGGFGWQQLSSYTPIATVRGTVSGTAYLFRTTTGGRSGAGAAPFNAASLTGPTIDGSITWTLSSTTQALADVETNYPVLTAAQAAAGWLVIATPWIPLCDAADIQLPQTITNRDAQRIAFGSFITAAAGSSGIAYTQQWQNDPFFSTPGYPTACNGSTLLCYGANCYNGDGVHFADKGGEYAGTTYTFPAIFYAISH